MKQFHRIVLVLACLLTTPLFLVYADNAHPVHKVGIVALDEADTFYLEAAADGIRNCDEFFEPVILSERVNLTDVPIEGNDYLNSAIFEQGDARALREKYDVDIILFVTNHSIDNWDEGRGGVWGQANRESGGALASYRFFSNKSGSHPVFFGRVALHEVFHLYGYPHNVWDTEGIMQHTMSFSSNLSTYYDDQAAVRSLTYDIYIDRENSESYYMAASIWALVLMPFYAGIELLVCRGHTLKTKKNMPVVIPVISLIIGFFFLVSLNDIRFFLLMPLVFFGFIHASYQFYLEAKEIIRKEKEKDKEKNKEKGKDRSVAEEE